MKRNYENLIKSAEHLKVLNEIFSESRNYSRQVDWEIYRDNSEKLSKLISSEDFDLPGQMYNQEGRQMILADIVEYIFMGRGYYAITSGNAEARKTKMKKYVESILRFVNILMSYESITVDDRLRKIFLLGLKERIPEVENEKLFHALVEFRGKVGLTQEKSDADKELNSYFDKVLPKTAGGLWHELLVYLFLIRHDLGYVLPLVLSQRLLCGSGNFSLVPPDFLIITKDKRIYGIEVGIKKEIQSGYFSLATGLPTATIDTINSRSSDRCPICNRWIPLCEKVIRDFSDLDRDIPLTRSKVSCLKECDIYDPEQVAEGKCPYTKYSRPEAKSLPYTHFKYADSLHYHYQCVLSAISLDERKLLVESRDETALKTHYPYYSGLEALL